MGDDSDTKLLKTAIIAGLLVLVGAGCGSKITSQTAQASHVEQPKVATSSNNGMAYENPFKETYPSRCFDSINDISAFQNDLNAYLKNANGVPSDFISTLHEQSDNGWKPVHICVTRISDTEGASSAIFVLQIFQNVTSVDLKEMKRQLPNSNKEKLNLGSFPGSKTWSLIKIGYTGEKPSPKNSLDEANLVATIVSSPIAVSGGSKEPALIEDFQDSNQSGSEEKIWMTVRGSEPDVYAETIAFYPFTNQIK